MARTGYKVTVYLDDNPNSPGYMEKYEERVLDEETCPIEQDDFILVATECEVVFSGKTGYRVDIYYNNTTGEYKQEKALDPECEASTDEEIWVPSGDPFCETTEQGVNTGYMVQLVVQKNQLLPNYGETKYNRWKSPECGSNNCAIWDDLQKQCHISVINCVATFDGTADVTQIDINPLSSTYNQTRTINKQDSDCENCTETTFSWVLVGDMCGDDELLCSNGIQQTSTNSYTVHRKYKTIGSASPVPMDEYQVVLKTEDDEDCGYIRPIYEMRRMPGEYLCDTETYTKYEKLSQYVSYDLGETWSLVSPEVSERGNVIAEESYDCGKPMYRWVFNGEYMCEDNGDDGKIRYYNSFSNGEFSDLKSSVPCNESDVLSGSEITSVTQTNYRRVGDCVRDVDGSVANNSVVLWLGNYVEEVGSITGYSGVTLDIPERVNKLGEIRSNYYFENLVMMPQYPVSATSVFQQSDRSQDNCAIWVAADTYEFWQEDAFWGNFDGRDVNTAKLLPMNNDNISWKARMHMKSDFNDWYYFIPDGEDETTITSQEGRYGRAIVTEINISDKVKTLSTSCFGDRNSGMKDFNSLTTLDLGYGVETIGDDVFNRNNFTEIHIPESVRTIGKNAFYGNSCSAITIPDSVNTIGEYAFYKFDHTLDRLEIGSGCTSIGHHVINAARTVVMNAFTPPSITRYTFGETLPNEILVLCELYDRYREQWSGVTAYTSVMRPYECSGEEVDIAVLYLDDGTAIEIKRDRKLITKTLFGDEVNDYMDSVSAITITSECNRINGMQTGNNEPSITFEGITPPTLVNVSGNFSEVNVPCQGYFNYYYDNDFSGYIEKFNECPMEYKQDVIPGEYVCVNGDKCTVIGTYRRVLGTTGEWYLDTSAGTTAGSVIEADSVDCRYKSFDEFISTSTTTCDRYDCSVSPVIQKITAIEVNIEYYAGNLYHNYFRVEIPGGSWLEFMCASSSVYYWDLVNGLNYGITYLADDESVDWINWVNKGKSGAIKVNFMQHYGDYCSLYIWGINFNSHTRALTKIYYDN